MIYTENTETWCQCDNCSLTMFAGFNMTGEEVKRSFGRDGWTFGKRVLCHMCTKDEGWIHRELAEIRRGNVDW